MVLAPCVSTAPVPPPAYHRAQAKVGPALHLDALTLITRSHLLAPARTCSHCAGWPCSWPVAAVLRHCPPVQGDARAAIARSRCSCWGCCARCGGCRIKTSMTG